MRCTWLALILLIGCSGVYRVPKYEAIRREYPDISRNPTLVEGKPLDIPGCIRVALKENPDYRIAMHRIEQASAETEKARATFFPSLDIEWRYLHADSPANFFATKLDQRKINLAGDLNNPGDFGSSNLSFRFGYQVNLGGAQMLRYKIASMRKEIGSLERDRIRNTLVSSIIITYYDTLATRRFLEIARQSVDTVASQLKETQIRYEGGGQLKSDVLSLDVRLAEARENLVKAKNFYHLQKNGLALLLGIDPKTPFEIEENDWEPATLPKSYEKGLEQALFNRPELEQARKKLISARYGCDLALSGYFPEFDLSGSYYFEDRDFKYSSKRDNWMVTGGLSWNVFRGFSTRAQTKKAKAMLKEMLVAERKTTLEIEHEVDRAYRNWNEGKERVEVLKIALKQAEENLELVKTRYQGGATTITRYLNTELALTNTRFQLTSALYDLKKAKAMVGRALGICGLCSE